MIEICSSSEYYGTVDLCDETNLWRGRFYLRYNILVLHILNSDGFVVNFTYYHLGMGGGWLELVKKSRFFKDLRKYCNYRGYHILHVHSYSYPFKDAHDFLIQDLTLPLTGTTSYKPPFAFIDHYKCIIQISKDPPEHYSLRYDEEYHKMIRTRVDIGKGVGNEMMCSKDECIPFLECKNPRHLPKLILPGTRYCEISGCVCAGTALVARCHSCASLVHQCPYKCQKNFTIGEDNKKKKVSYLNQIIRAHIKTTGHSGPKQPRFKDSTISESVYAERIPKVAELIEEIFTSE